MYWFMPLCTLHFVLADLFPSFDFYFHFVGYWALVCEYILLSVIFLIFNHLNDISKAFRAQPLDVSMTSLRPYSASLKALAASSFRRSFWVLRKRLSFISWEAATRAILLCSFNSAEIVSMTNCHWAFLLSSLLILMRYCLLLDSSLADHFSQAS